MPLRIVGMDAIKNRENVIGVEPKDGAAGKIGLVMVVMVKLVEIMHIGVY